MHLFAYGTLLVPRIWEAVTGMTSIESEEANLLHHQIFRVEGGDFPGIVESSDPCAQVPGRVFFNLPPDVLSALDRYEDSFYERVSVSVQSAQQEIDAQVYRIPVSHASEILSEDPWTLEWFEREAFHRYWNRLFA